MGKSSVEWQVTSRGNRRTMVATLGACQESSPWITPDRDAASTPSESGIATLCDRRGNADDEPTESAGLEDALRHIACALACALDREDDRPGTPGCDPMARYGDSVETRAAEENKHG
jgi:hypothetical protein